MILAVQHSAVVIIFLYSEHFHTYVDDITTISSMKVGMHISVLFMYGCMHFNKYVCMNVCIYVCVYS